jgi:hypothetical protein
VPEVAIEAVAIEAVEIIRTTYERSQSKMKSDHKKSKKLKKELRCRRAKS